MGFDLFLVLVVGFWGCLMLIFLFLCFGVWFVCFCYFWLGFGVVDFVLGGLVWLLLLIFCLVVLGFGCCFLLVGFGGCMLLIFCLFALGFGLLRFFFVSIAVDYSHVWVGFFWRAVLAGWVWVLFPYHINLEVQSCYHCFWEQRPLNWQQEHLAPDAQNQEEKL